MLVGGALSDNNTAVWERIVALGGGSGAKFGVLTAGSVPASQDPKAGTPECSNAECNGDFYGNLLRRYGAGSAEWIPIDLDKASAAEDEALATKVRGMTGFFLGGGDQSRYTTLLFQKNGGADTKVLAAMKSAVQAGAVIAGTSAGAAVLQGAVMITGGETYHGLLDGSSDQSSDSADKLTYRAAGGLGFFTAGLVDTHFAARGREGRIIRLASDTKKTLAFGVDEDTALFATGGSLSVLGRHAVHILDLRDAQASSGSRWSISTVRWSVLNSGDSYDVASFQITAGRGTSPYKGEDRSVTFRSRDVFSSPDAPSGSSGRASPYEIVKLAEDLVSSRQSKSASGETWESSPIYGVTLSLGKSFSAWRSESRLISFQDLVVDIASV